MIPERSWEHRSSETFDMMLDLQPVVNPSPSDIESSPGGIDLQAVIIVCRMHGSNFLSA